MAVDLDISGADLVVRPRGWHRLWALRREVRVPLDRVTGARVEQRLSRRLVRGWRAPGADLPGVIVAGTFRRRGGAKTFADARPKRPAVVVDLAAGAGFERIVVGTDDPAGAVSRIEAARGRR